MLDIILFCAVWFSLISKIWIHSLFENALENEIEKEGKKRKGRAICPRPGGLLAQQTFPPWRASSRPGPEVAAQHPPLPSPRSETRPSRAPFPLSDWQPGPLPLPADRRDPHVSAFLFPCTWPSSTPERRSIPWFPCQRGQIESYKAFLHPEALLSDPSRLNQALATVSVRFGSRRESYPPPHAASRFRRFSAREKSLGESAVSSSFSRSLYFEVWFTVARNTRAPARSAMAPPPGAQLRPATTGAPVYGHGSLRSRRILDQAPRLELTPSG